MRGKWGVRRPRNIHLLVTPVVGLVLIALMVGLAVVLRWPCAEPATAYPPANVVATGVLIWSDEFDGAAGSPPDSDNWVHNTGGNGWGNDELEYYTDSTSNAALDGMGNLVITAKEEDASDYACHYGSCDYTSARLMTAGRFSQTYGRFEARLTLPTGYGLWPAFWLLGEEDTDDGQGDDSSEQESNTGEIDIMENVGSEPGTVYGSLHGPGYSGNDGLTSRYTLPRGKALANTFHVFTVDWTPTSITWYVDNVPYARKTAADLNGARWVFNHPFFIILNLAVGGAWAGEPSENTIFPQSMIIDYVRVTELVTTTTSG